MKNPREKQFVNFKNPEAWSLKGKLVAKNTSLWWDLIAIRFLQFETAWFWPLRLEIDFKIESGLKMNQDFKLHFLS